MIGRLTVFTLALASILSLPATSLAQTLAEAKRGFETNLHRQDRQNRPLPAPPDDLFTLVSYNAPSGPTAAYLSRTEVAPGEKRPAIVWLTGGFPVARGGSYIWTPGPHTNEQSATAFRNAGVVLSGRMHQSCPPILVLCVYVSVLGQKQFHDIITAFHCRKPQRCQSSLFFRVYISSLISQELHDAGITFRSRVPQGCPTIRLDRIDISTFVQ